MSKFKFMYDRESDSLLVYREDRKNKASVNLGEVIIDLDKNYNISAVEILNPDFLYGIPKAKLSQIKEANVKIDKRGNIFWIFIILKFEGSREIEKIPLPLNLSRKIAA
ncbi:MAG: DUF2283 domain-containing protein [Candidatus Micrarchaeota archaeon]|nr:DUF2283 domain-containing protein [Candidatus Micrarchaeota archaeon]